MNEELESKYLELMLWSWGHNTRGQAGAIRDCMHLIRHYLEKPAPDFSRIHFLLDHVDQISEKLGAETPSPLQFEQTSLNTLIKKRVKSWELRGTCCPVTFQVTLEPSQPVVDTNSIWLERLLNILIENAVEATNKSQNKFIQISTLVDRQGVTMVVNDTGEGIDMELLPRLLQQPLTLPVGRGRGLYIARLIVEIYGGTIAVASTAPTGTTIEIWLPLSKGASRHA